MRILVRSAVLSFLLLLPGARAFADQKPVPEVIDAGAFYFPTEKQADDAKRDREAHHPNNNYRFIVGSSDPKDYVKPSLVRAVEPIYPAMPVSERRSASVVAEAVIASNGYVIEAYVVRSTDGRYESAAVEALMAYKFKPKLYKGHPVMSIVSVPFNFRP